MLRIGDGYSVGVGCFCGCSHVRVLLKRHHCSSIKIKLIRRLFPTDGDSDEGAQGR